MKMKKKTRPVTIHTYKLSTFPAVIICEKFKAICPEPFQKHLSSWRCSISESNSTLFYNAVAAPLTKQSYQF